VVEAAAAIIEENGDARTATKALKVLGENIDRIKAVVTERRKRSENEDFTFTYEEEADPEIFFVPYVWEVVVSVITSGSLEWNKNGIQVFPLLEEVMLSEVHVATDEPSTTVQEYSQDVSDVV
jgi:hypothetical protein